MTKECVLPKYLPPPPKYQVVCVVARSLCGAAVMAGVAWSMHDCVSDHHT